MRPGWMSVRRTTLNAVAVAAITLLITAAIGTTALAQQPWDTASGKACFEQWIADATSRLNRTPGDPEFESRKPWRFNEYGLLAGRGIASNYAPDDWGKCGGNRYCYMWWLLDYTNGFGARWPIWQRAGIPPLQPFIWSCAGGPLPQPPGPPGPVDRYAPTGGLACWGGATYPSSWSAEANCGSYGCKFGTMSLAECLALGRIKGAREVIHGNSGGSRANECWLQNSCADLRPSPDFTYYRAAGTPPPPLPPVSGYVARGTWACFGGARYPPDWTREASCSEWGCNFGRLDRNQCLELAARRGAREVIHGNPTGGRANECWMQTSCPDLRPHADFTLFQPR